MNTNLLILAIGILIYLFMITPRVKDRPPRAAFEERQYFAHRGLYDNAAGIPENSLPAFQRAIDAGFGIELDVQLTADDVPVVFHDFTLKRMCGAAGSAKDYSYEELKAFRLLDTDETIPTFEEVLQLVAGRAPLIVEMKMRFLEFDVCRRAQALLTDYEGAYCVESFNPLALCWYRNVHPSVVRGQLSENFFRDKTVKPVLRPFVYLLSLLLSNFATKPDFIAYSQDACRNISFFLNRKLFHSVPVAWTIRSKEQLAKARKRYDVFIFENFVPEEGGEKAVREAG